MATARDIKKRIRSVKSTQQITRAMKMVAAAKLRRAQETALAARPYGTKLGEVLRSVVARADLSAHPLFRPQESKITVLVVVTSDRGLCGGFNSNLCRRAVETERELRAAGRKVVLYCIGRRARDYFKRRHYEIAHEKLNIFQKLGFGHAKLIATELMEMFQSGQAGEIVLCYNEFKSVIAPRIVVEPLLPIPQSEVAGGTDAPRPAEIDYIYEPAPDRILDALVPWHVNTQIWRVLIESSAAEQGARMAAMEAATKNAGEIVDKLTLTMNKARQATITKELIEVVSGAAALTH